MPTSQRNLQRVNQNRLVTHLDWNVLYLILALLIFGFVMVSSASIGIAEREIGKPFFYAMRHGVSVGLGICAGVVAFSIPIHWWQKYTVGLWVLALVLLIVVLIPPIGISINGARRWLPLGFMTFQASELMKLANILFFAHIIELMRAQLIQEQWAFLKPVLILCVPMILLLLEPDFGAASVIAITAAAMLFISGIPLRPFLSLGALSVLLMGGIAALAPYRMARLTAFVDPWADQFDSGYQLTQALIAFGRGEWFGVGLGESVQKLFYLPEAFSDFLFAIISEELGLVGGIALCSVYAALSLKGFRISKRAAEQGETYLSLVCFGIIFWISIQALINIGVNSGILPTKGLTLPLVSAGGSSILLICIALGIVLRIDCHLKEIQKQRRPVVRRK